MRKAFWGAHRGMIESKEQREKFLEELPELAIDLAMAVDSGETPCQELRCGACCEPLDRHVFRGQAIA